jgi:hypothetical protein
MENKEETIKIICDYNKSVIFFFDEQKNSMLLEFTQTDYNLIINKEFLYFNNKIRLEIIEYFSLLANEYIEKNPITSAIGFYNYLKFVDRQKKINSLII